MIFYILRRILYAVPIALGVSVVCFSLVYIAPGDPLQTVMPPDATAETIEIVKHAYGFDKPIPVQYLIWLGRLSTGDMGMSISTRRPVFLEVTDALANTSLLALFAVPIAFSLGYAIGVVAGFAGGRINTAIMRTMDVFYAFPSVLLAVAVAEAMGGGIANGMLDAIPGSPPDMRRLSPGYSFAPRCSRRTAVCRMMVPEPQFPAPGRMAACVNLPTAAIWIRGD